MYCPILGSGNVVCGVRFLVSFCTREPAVKHRTNDSRIGGQSRIEQAGNKSLRDASVVIECHRVGIAFRERNSESKFAPPSPAEVFTGYNDTFIADLGIIAPVVNDQVLGALALQVADEGMC